MKLPTRTLHLALVAAGMGVSATAVAFDLDPSTWFRAARPEVASVAADASAAAAAVLALPAGATPNYRAIVRQAGPAVVGVTVAGPSGRLRKLRTHPFDPLLPVGTFQANDWSTLETATRRNGSKEPRLGKPTLADARPLCRSA